MKKHALFLLLLFACFCACEPGRQGPGNKQRMAAAHFVKGAAYRCGGRMNNASLKIDDVADSGFAFALNTMNGCNEAQIEGFARFINDTEGRYKNGDETVVFTIRSSSVLVSEHGYHRGSGGIDFDHETWGINFDDEYKRGFDIADAYTADTAGIDVLDAAANKDLKNRVGSKYTLLAMCMERHSQNKLPDAAGYNVYSGCIKLPFTFFEAKILARPTYYYAGLVAEDTLFLYTNDPIYLADTSKRPKAIEGWIPQMSHSVTVVGY